MDSPPRRSAVQRARLGAVDPTLDDAAQRARRASHRAHLAARAGIRRSCPNGPRQPASRSSRARSTASTPNSTPDAVEIVAPLVDAVLADVLRFDERAVGLTPTPAIAATLDAKQIGELAGDERIDMIYDAPVATADLGVAKQTTGVTQVHGIGLDGTGVRVGVVEVGGRTESASWLMRPVQQNTTNVCANPTQHTTNVTSVIAGQRVNVFGQIVGEDGVSKRADVLVGGSCTGVTAELQTAATRAADWGARTHQPQLGKRHEPRHRRWRSVLRRDGPQPLAHHREVGGQSQLRQHRRTGRDARRRRHQPWARLQRHHGRRSRRSGHRAVERRHDVRLLQLR